MIENRHRIEKEILLGRQSTRRHLSRNRVETAGGSESVTEVVTGTRPPRLTASPTRIIHDLPISVDTDAEAAYAIDLKSASKRGRPASELFKRDSNGPAAQDPLRSPLARRRWASELLDADHADGSDDGSRRRGSRRTPPNTTPKLNESPTNSGFFMRFRTQSFSTLSRSKALAKEGSVGDAWSSDSSSDDEFSLQDPRHIHHPSVLNLDSMDGGDGDSDFEEQIG